MMGKKKCMQVEHVCIHFSVSAIKLNQHLKKKKKRNCNVYLFISHKVEVHKFEIQIKDPTVFLLLP